LGWARVLGNVFAYDAFFPFFDKTIGEVLKKKFLLMYIRLILLFFLKCKTFDITMKKQLVLGCLLPFKWIILPPHSFISNPRFKKI